MPVLRLKQNKAPKIVLQVLLGVMAVCGAIAYSMLKTKELLRQSPCSIAGKMELLARSELCSTRKVIPEGAEWWDQRQRRQYGMFDGWFFSLCWWGIERKWYGINIRERREAATWLRTVPISLRGSPQFRRASRARNYRSARGLKDLIRCDNTAYIYIYSNAATMFKSIKDRLLATVRCWQRGAWW